MKEYIADGKIRARSYDQAYVAIEMENFEFSSLCKKFIDAQNYLMEKMIDYLQSFYKDKLKQMLIDCMRDCHLFEYIKCNYSEPNQKSLNLHILFIPFCFKSTYKINEKSSGILCLLFKRADKDDLDE